MDEQLKKFCKNYEVKVVNDTQRYARYRPPSFFTDPARADIIRNDLVDMQTETLYTVQIPESRLKALVELESRFYNHRNSDGMRDMFETLMDKEREEAFYRNSNEAVKKAYEQYSLMLNLAGYQRKF
jgi:hypothetical protein